MILVENVFCITFGQTEIDPKCTTSEYKATNNLRINESQNATGYKWGSSLFS